MAVIGDATIIVRAITEPFQKDLEKARLSFNKLVRSGYALGPALSAAVSGLSDLVSGLFALGSAVGAATPALAALPGVLSAVIQAFATAKVAFGGFGKAMSAYMKNQEELKKAGKDTVAADRAVADARKALARAYQDAADRLYDSNQRVTDSQRNLQEVYQDAAQALFDADQSVADAQRELAQESRDLKRAQDALTEAYAAGREELQQLGFNAEQAALAEKKAGIALERARETLRQTQDLPPDSRARRDAELAYQEAELSYRQAKDRSADLNKAQEEAAKTGVDGTKAVTDARNNLAAAENAVAQARRALQDKEIARQRVINDNDERIAEARERVQRAELERQRVIRDNAESIADAQERLARALQDQAKKSKEAIQKGLVDPFKEVSAEAEAFIKYIANTVRPEMLKLRYAAGEKLFPKLTTSLQTIVSKLFPVLIPILRDMGGVIGDIAIAFSDMLTKASTLDIIKRVFGGTNLQVMRDLGTAAVAVAEALLKILDAVSPLVLRFTGWIVKTAEKFKAFIDFKSTLTGIGDTVSPLTAIFNRAGDIFGKIAGALGKLLSNFFTLGGEAVDAGIKIIDAFSGAMDKFAAFNEEGKKSGLLKTIFSGAADNLIKFGGLIGDLIKEFFLLGGDKGIGQVIDILRGGVPFLRDMIIALRDGAPALASFAVSFLKLLSQLSESGGIKTFFATLKTATDFVSRIFENEVVMRVFLFTSTIAGFTLALGTLGTVASFVGKALLAKLLFVFNMLDGIIYRVASGVRFLSLALGIGLGPAWLIVGAIAAVVAILVIAYQKSEIFRKAVKDMIDNVIKRAQQIFDRLREKVEKALKPLGGIEGATEKVGEAFKFLGDIIGKYVIPLVEGGLKNALEIIGAVFGIVIDTVGNAIEAIMGIIDAVKRGDWKGVFENVVKLITAPFRAIAGNLWDLVVNIWNNIVEAVKKVLGISSPSKVFMAIAQAIFDGIKAVLSGLGAMFWNLFTTAIGVIKTLITSTLIPEFLKLPLRLALAAAAIFTWIVPKLKEAFTALVAYVRDTVIPFIAGFPARFLAANVTLFNWLKDLAVKKWGELTKWWNETVWPWITGLPQTIKDKAAGVWDGLRVAFINMLNGLIAAWNEFKLTLDFSGLKDTLSNPFFRFVSPAAYAASQLLPNSYTIDPPNVSPIALARGGVVLPRRGGTLARIAEAGRAERVEPLDRDGLSVRDRAMVKALAGGMSNGNVVVNVYPSEGMSELEVAQQVSRTLTRVRRRGT